MDIDAIDIQAPPARLWDFLTDPRNLPKWNPKAVRVDARGPLTREGDEYWVTYRLGNRETTHLARVSKFVPESQLELVLTSVQLAPGTQITERYELAPGPGHVRLSQTVDLGKSGVPGWARLLMALFQKIGKPTGKRYLESLKECVESGPP